MEEDKDIEDAIRILKSLMPWPLSGDMMIVKIESTICLNK